MAVTWNQQGFVEIENASPRLLLKVALLLQAALMEKLGVHWGGEPSKPGEYPRKRTGNLQAGVQIDPSTAEGIKAAGLVRLGYASNAFYGAVLELKLDRKGLFANLQEELARIEALTP